MKPSPDKPLRTAIAAHASLIVELANLSALSTETASRLTQLEAEADLSDTKALSEITRLQTVNELLPRRIASREQALANAVGTVLAECHTLVQTHLGPTARRIVAQTRARVETALRPHFREELELDRAVNASVQMQEVNGLEWSVKVEDPRDPAGVLRYAERLLQAAARLQEMDANQPAAAAA